MIAKFDDFITSQLKGRKHFEYGLIDSCTLWVTRWSWDYLSALDFQKAAINFVKSNPLLKIYIFCSHPHCFTMGRGLQKNTGHKIEGLIDFDNRQRLPFTCHKINRGGGLTFHYPGQWIFYPIINLGNPHYRLKEITFWLLESSKIVLEKFFQISNLDTQRKFLGLWHKNNKIASIGIGVERYVTHHGIALNLQWDNDMFLKLKKINPCGIDPSIYSSVDQIICSEQKDSLSQFHYQFMKYLQTYGTNADC